MGKDVNLLFNHTKTMGMPIIGRNKEAQNLAQAQAQEKIKTYQEKIFRISKEIMDKFEEEQLQYIDVINVCNYTLEKIKVDCEQLNLNYIREVKGK